MAGSGCLCGGTFGASEVLRNYDARKSQLKRISSRGSEVVVTWFGQAPTEAPLSSEEGTEEHAEEKPAGVGQAEPVEEMD